MPDYIYVLGKDGQPQMPTRRRRHVERLLSKKQARIVEHIPFTIQLLYDNDPVLQPVLLAEDPGRTNIGVSAVSEKGDILFSGVVEIRNKAIVKLMEKRKKMRRASRMGERKVRQRRAKQFNTVVQGGKIQRRLPGFGEDKTITCHYIRNTESRYCNRKRKPGWLTPSAEHLVRTHIHVIHLVQRFLPVTDVALEVNRFAFARMEDPSLSGIDFQNGRLKGYDSKKDAVCKQQNGICLLCKKEIECYHHIVPRSENGSDTMENLAGLCGFCHEKVHKNEKARARLAKKKAGLVKKYGVLSVLNQAIPFICKHLEEEFKPEHVHYCEGSTTAVLRKRYRITKTKEEQSHEKDAWCIAVAAFADTDRPVHTAEFPVPYRIRQFRRQDRAVIKSEHMRTYKLDGIIVARNRHKAIGQKKDSLEEWYASQTALYGNDIAEQFRSRLQVTKSTRSYNNPERLMPGAVFLHNRQRYVLSGQLTNGKYFRAAGLKTTVNFPAKDCQIVKRNTGLVFL